MKLFNTLSRQKEEFKSINDKKAGLYTCGPTVYDVAHIGNLRTYLFEDLLKRVLIEEGFTVNHVMNITDVDDKTIKKAAGKKDEFSVLTKKYEELFFNDLASLNIIKPNVITRATEYIEKMVSFIEDLEKKGYAYKASDGSIYFSIDKFADYGKLSKLDREGIKTGARVSQDEYDKENPADFALWKAWDESDGDIFWDPSTWLGAGTSLGKGRPGWHIECSAMATDVLGETIDIHAGAVDLIFPHHENEIAQAEARNGKKFVNFWIHGEHLLVDNKKMSKSLGNLYILNDLKDKGYSPLDFRYLILGAHYRTKLNFTWEGLTAAKNSRERLSRIVSSAKKDAKEESSPKYLKKFYDRVKNDLDLPEGLAVLWEMLRDPELEQSQKYTTAIKMDEILGLNLAAGETEREIPAEITQMAEDRKKAKKNGNYGLSDKLREEIEEKGYKVEDLSNGEYKIS